MLSFIGKLFGNALVASGSGALVLSLASQLDSTFQLYGLAGIVVGCVISALLSASRWGQMFMSLILFLFAGGIANYAAGNQEELAGVYTAGLSLIVAIFAFLFARWNRRSFGPDAEAESVFQISPNSPRSPTRSGIKSSVLAD